MHITHRMLTCKIKIRVPKSEAVTGNNTLPTLSDSECDFKGDG
jgi:hypothetical protein